MLAKADDVWDCDLCMDLDPLPGWLGTWGLGIIQALK